LPDSISEFWREVGGFCPRFAPPKLRIFPFDCQCSVINDFAWV
jgi:hypothetical protein